MFTFDVFWYSLGIFGNSSSAAINTRSRLTTRLSFRFLGLSIVFYRLFSPRNLNLLGKYLLTTRYPKNRLAFYSGNKHNKKNECKYIRKPFSAIRKPKYVFEILFSKYFWIKACSDLRFLILKFILNHF